MHDSSHQSVSDVAFGRHLALVRRGTWEFARRRQVSGVVCVLAVSPQGLLLVEQYRPPVDRRVIELPAGLAGDIADARDEALETAARRELLEETGYAASTLRHLTDVTSSAGLTDELVSIFLATGLERLGAGGGDESESIDVHEIPISTIDEWLRERQADGVLVDPRVFAGLYFLQLEADRNSKHQTA